jgi:hypothetical protein
MHDLSPATEPPQAPPAETERGPDLSVTARWVGRRLADAVNEAFQVALARGDTRMAEDLLAVLERAWERERAKVRFDRRHADPLLDLARRELQTVKARRRRC